MYLSPSISYSSICSSSTSKAGCLKATTPTGNSLTKSTVYSEVFKAGLVAFKHPALEIEEEQIEE